MYKNSTDGLFTNLLGQPTAPKQIKFFYPTRFYGVVQVINSSSRKNLVVKFLEDGTTRNVSLHNLIKGKCKNQNVKKRTSVELSTHFDDKVYKNKNNCEFRILSRSGKYCNVKFILTGTEVNALIVNAIKGKIIDPLHPSVYGIGFLGKNSELSVAYKKEYILWHNMLKRAYCKEDKKGYYGRVSVDAQWHNFSNFLKDLPELRNYDKWVDGQNSKENPAYNLDKDFAYYGCDIYSKENCQFILESLNKGTTSKTLNALSRINKYNEGLANE